MRLPRFQLVELEDLAWLPHTVRDLATDYLRFMESRFGLHRPVVGRLADLIRATGEARIVDFCSGGGGPMAQVVTELAEAGLEPHATLTDLYPHREAFERLASEAQGRIDFVAAPVDAREPPADLPGLRTFFNALHHFEPDDVKAILASAVQQREPVAVFEIPERRLLTALSFLVTPFVVWVLTPLIRPFVWRRLFWTYLLPAVPLVCVWDGFVSHLRAYHPDELLSMARAVDGGAYDWEAGVDTFPELPVRLTYLVGRPVEGA